MGIRTTGLNVLKDSATEWVGELFPGPIGVRQTCEMVEKRLMGGIGA